MKWGSTTTQRKIVHGDVAITARGIVTHGITTHGITTHGTSKYTMAATIIDTITVDTIGATDIIVASGLTSLAGSTVIIVIKNANISIKASLVQHIKED